MYGFLASSIDSAFPDSASSVEMVYQPSMEAVRVENVDEFTYEVKFDLRLMVDRNKVKDEILAPNNDRKFVIGSATVKDVVCKVTFTP